MAYSKEEAQDLIKNVSSNWEWYLYKGELMEAPEIHEEPFGAWISGGG